MLLGFKKKLSTYKTDIPIDDFVNEFEKQF